MKSVNFVDQVEAIPEEGTKNDTRQSTRRSSLGLAKDTTAANKRNVQNNQSDFSESTNFSSPDSEMFYQYSGFSDEDSGVMSKEERARTIRERHEIERQRRLEQLIEAKKQAEAYREQQMLLKKQRIHESKAKEFERRKSVEERRKRLEEIEQIRRENLQRKLERIERSNDARRNNGGPQGRLFGFGSCTPREICTPIRRATLTPQPLTQQTSKQHRNGTVLKRTVLSTPDVHWLSGRRGSNDWGTSGRGLRGPGASPSAHATLMTGSFTVAMSSPSTIGLHHRRSNAGDAENASMKKAASTTHLAKGPPGQRKANRIVPYPSEKDKLDRAVSTPNIAAGSQKAKARRAAGGAQSPIRSLEGSRRPSASARNISDRPRPASAMGHQRSESLPRRNSSTLVASSPTSSASSAFFDRLSQPKRVSLRTEEAVPERRRGSTSTPGNNAPSHNSTPKSAQSTPRTPQPPKWVPRPSSSGSDNSPPARPTVVTFEMDKAVVEEEETAHPLVTVSVEDVEADALADDREMRLDLTEEAQDEEEAEEASTSGQENTSAGATPLPSDRSSSPPRSLALGVAPAAPAVQLAPSSPSPARSEPEMSSQTPRNLRSANDSDLLLGSRHPPTSALPPPSPPPHLNKGSAPSTPTGQREFPRASSTREVTEEEYRQRIAEQRRLARERMAAQEAEKARAREEERRIREEELQRLREAAERQQREEEEQRQREEEQRRREAEEEERQEAERLQKEREEAERRQQQLERERQEQLRREEAGRQERRKRLETIMSRVKKSGDMGSRESLSSSHLDLSADLNGSQLALDAEPERPLSPAPQFKSALLQSMLSKGRLSTSIRAVSALRRSQGPTGSTGSLIGDLQNLSRSSESLSSTSNSGPTVPTSSSGEVQTSQTEVQLSPPPVVNPSMWRSHPNGIPGLGGHERDAEMRSDDFGDEEVDTNPAIIVNSIRSRLSARQSIGSATLDQETSRSRPNSVHFEDMISLPRGGTDRGDIVNDESTSEDSEIILPRKPMSGTWLAEDQALPTSMAPREMADLMS